MIEYSDTELVDLALGGDECAFENLIRKHYSSVFNLSYRWCRIREDAEEITQEVFLKLTRWLDTFNRKSSFKTWLYRITINTAKDYSRRSSTRRSYESAFAREQSSENPGISPIEYAKANRIYDAIDALPHEQKASLMLVMTEGLSHREAAGILKCSETTVSWRIHKARKKLKKIIAGWDDNGK